MKLKNFPCKLERLKVLVGDLECKHACMKAQAGRKSQRVHSCPTKQIQSPPLFAPVNCTYYNVLQCCCTHTHTHTQRLERLGYSCLPSTSTQEVITSQWLLTCVSHHMNSSNMKNMTKGLEYSDG